MRENERELERKREKERAYFCLRAKIVAATDHETVFP